jgi:uncharacterized protein YjiS (DUF1127 family)
MAQTLTTSGFKASNRSAHSSALEQGLIRAFDVLRDWTQRRRTRNHLYRMPDYILRDIGVSRAEVTEEFSKPFWKE